jgi:hypothetical protein
MTAATCQARYYAKHKERITMSRKVYRSSNPAVMLKWRLKAKYNLTPGQWESIFVAQGRCCAICKTPTPNGNKRKNGTATWATDHDHKTGKVRGILCNNCNHGLGHFKDNQTLLRLATDYLDKAEN